MVQDKVVTKTISINAPVSRVWEALTNLELVREWQSPEGTTYITTTWEVGSPIAFSGVWRRIKLQDKGVVLQFEKERALQYSYWSKLSRLPDIPENYSITGFNLEPHDNSTMLTVSLSHFPLETNYGHTNFYWATALRRIKNLVESKYEQESGTGAQISGAP